MARLVARPSAPAALVALVLALDPTRAWAQLAETPPELQGVDVREHMNAQVPGEAAFRDTTGRVVQLRQYFDGRRPVVLNLMYNRCPMLCSLVLNGLIAGLRETEWTVGNQFQVVSISIDPHDTPRAADDKRYRALRSYGRAGAERGWHFLVGDEANIRRVADAVGFGYRYDRTQNEFAHPAAIVLLTPEGRVARYLYGLQFDPQNLRFGLLEASQGRSINTTLVERVLLWCFHYDPQGRKYVLVARRVMQLGGAVTVVLLGGLMLVLWTRDRRHRATASSAPRAGASAGAYQDLRGQG